LDIGGTQVDLLIAILVRFPAIGTIHCEPETGTLRLVFLIRGADQDFEDFARRFQAHLALFHRLRRKGSPEAVLSQKENGQLTVVEVTRDLANISLAELKLIVELFRDYYGECLVQDGPAMVEEDAFEQDLLIEALLNERGEVGPERLTGFRENGRVLVYSTIWGVDRR